MSEETVPCPNPPSQMLEEFQVIDMINYIGWSESEFAEACMDFTVEDAENFNWHQVLKDLWEATYSRIHSFLDLRHRFRYYNDWKHIVDYTLALNKLRVIDTTNIEPLTLKELEEDLQKRNKAILPTNTLEKEVVWALTSLIVQLHNYLCAYPEAAFTQIMEIREGVENRKKEEELKREARRLKKAEQRQRKRKSRR